MANALFDITAVCKYGDHPLENFLLFGLTKRKMDEAFSGSLDDIGKSMQKAARTFIDINGTKKTGDLKDNITYRVYKQNKQLVLYVPVGFSTKNPGWRGDYRYYAGHIEYGFWLKGLNNKYVAFKGPWPYLRPAMRYGAALSAENIGDNLAQLITGRLNWYTKSRGPGNTSMYSLKLGSDKKESQLSTETKTPNWRGYSGQYSKYREIRDGR